MFFPTELMRFSLRDVGGELLEPFITDSVLSAAAAQVNSDLQVTVGFSLLLQSVVASFQPGAAQNFTVVSVGLVPPDGTNFVELNLNRTAGAANVSGVLTWSGSVLVPPRWIIRASGAYNAGVANNITRLDAVGMLVPVANTA